MHVKLEDWAFRVKMKKNKPMQSVTPTPVAISRWQ
jgi:hypothetical protein